MANLITLGRLILFFLTLGLIYTRQTGLVQLSTILMIIVIVSDALDGLGYPHQSPRVQLQPLTTTGVLIGRCKTTLWADMAHPDPQPYELELKAVDTCQADDVLIAASMLVITVMLLVSSGEAAMLRSARGRRP
mgnify:CR=1 FL=1